MPTNTTGTALPKDVTNVMHYDRLIDMPREELAELYRMHSDLLEAELTDVLVLEGDEQCLVAYGMAAQGTPMTHPIGMLVWRETEPGEWWMQLAYTRVGHRKGGLYRYLWSRMCSLAARDGTVVEIVIGTDYHNKPMQKVLAKTKAVPASIIYKYRIK